MSVTYLLTYFVTKWVSLGSYRRKDEVSLQECRQLTMAAQQKMSICPSASAFPQPLTVYKPRGRNWTVWAALPCRTGIFWAQSLADLVQCADSHSCCESQCAREGHPSRQALTTGYWRCVQSLPPDATLMDIGFLLWNEDEAKKKNYCFKLVLLIPWLKIRNAKIYKKGEIVKFPIILGNIMHGLSIA